MIERSQSSGSMTTRLPKGMLQVCTQARVFFHYLWKNRHFNSQIHGMSFSLQAGILFLVSICCLNAVSSLLSSTITLLPIPGSTIQWSLEYVHFFQTGDCTISPSASVAIANRPSQPVPLELSHLYKNGVRSCRWSRM